MGSKTIVIKVHGPQMSGKTTKIIPAIVEKLNEIGLSSIVYDAQFDKMDEYRAMRTAWSNGIDVAILESR